MESCDAGQPIRYMAKAALRGAENFRFYADRAPGAGDGRALPDAASPNDARAARASGAVPLARFIGLRVEAELAFVLKAPLAGASLTIGDVIAATDYVTPALMFPFARIVEYVLTFCTLQPGDIIFTGTPAGAGARMNPPV